MPRWGGGARARPAGGAGAGERTPPPPAQPGDPASPGVAAQGPSPSWPRAPPGDREEPSSCLTGSRGSAREPPGSGFRRYLRSAGGRLVLTSSFAWTRVVHDASVARRSPSGLERRASSNRCGGDPPRRVPNHSGNGPRSATSANAPIMRSRPHCASTKAWRDAGSPISTCRLLPWGGQASTRFCHGAQVLQRVTVPPTASLAQVWRSSTFDAQILM
jgi:hypothetical protein